MCYPIRFKISLLAFGFLLPFFSVGQKAIRILSAVDEKPLEGSLVHYQAIPRDKKAVQGVMFTGPDGHAIVPLKGQFFLYVNSPGYTSITDTLDETDREKTYRLQKLNKVLDEVVVTGQYAPNTVEQSAIRVKVFDSRRIERQAAMNLGTLLSNELNIRIGNDPFTGSSMSLQGLSGQNVKVLIDGVPLIGRLNGNIDLSQVNLNNVERVEVIEGPMSVIYGSDALGGVVNVISKKEIDPQKRIAINSYYETVGHYNFDARVAVPYQKSKLIVSGGRYFFQGFTQDATQRAKPWKPKEQDFADLNYIFRLGKSQHRVYSQLLRENLISRGNATITPYEAYAFDDFYITWRSVNALHSDFYLKNNGHLSFITAYSWYSRQRESYRRNLVNLEDTRINNNEQQDTNTFNHVLARGMYNSGNFFRKVNFQSGYDINYENGKGRRLRSGTQEIADMALFATAEYKPVNRLLLRPGLRAAWNSAFSVPVLPTLHLKYDASTAVSIRASYARGYRAPSLKELNLFFVDMNHNVMGNPALQPEQSDNWQASTTWQHRSAKKVYKLDLSSFYNNLRNMISLVMQDASQQLYSYANIDKFRSQGLNLQGEIRSEIYSFQAGVARIGRSSTFANQQATGFVYTNELRCNFMYRIPRIKTEFSVFYKYNGRQQAYMQDASNKTYLSFMDPYSMLDANLGRYMMKGKMYVSAGGKNLLNVVNVNSNITGPIHSNGSGQMLMGTGRSCFLNIKYYIGWKAKSA